MDLETDELLPETQSAPPMGFAVGAAFISCVVWLMLLLGRVAPFAN
jgi:hypothetical protein